MFMNFSKKDSYRLIFGEADLIPGLICDLFCDVEGKIYLVVQFLSMSCDVFRTEILNALLKIVKPDFIFERSDNSVREKEGLPLVAGWLNLEDSDFSIASENDEKYIGKDNVYDIEVEDSHSFTVQNTIVHNCQDLSLAGKGKGMQKGSGTRSGLLWEVERLLDECEELPQILLMENLPQVHSEDNMPDFIAWQNKLEILGYTNYWQDLNAKDYGIPQNRNRCFMISILGQYYYEFPKPFKLELRLKDMLESEVDEKYYLSDKMIECFMSNGMIPTLKTQCNDVGVVVVGNYSPSNHNASRIVDTEGLAPTVMENHGTVTAVAEKLRIRKLTPKECYRLMGFTDEDYEKASKVNSNAQLYKQAGNSIVVNVLMNIFKQLL